MNKLQREAVIRTALELLNDVGMEGLTTRRLAERLGVQQPALYWHFKNKRALLDALAEAMLTINHTHSTPRDDDDWRSFLKGNACSFRRALLAYRDGARIHAGTRPAAPQMEKADAQLRFLCDAGFSAGDATYALMAISYFTVGAVLEQQASEADAEERGEDQLTTSASTMPARLQSAMKIVYEGGPDAALLIGILISGLGSEGGNNSYTSDPPLFSVQAHPHPHVRSVFPARPENAHSILFLRPAVNAGPQKTP